MYDEPAPGHVRATGQFHTQPTQDVNSNRMQPLPGQPPRRAGESGWAWPKRPTITCPVAQAVRVLEQLQPAEQDWLFASLPISHHHRGQRASKPHADEVAQHPRLDRRHRRIHHLDQRLLRSPRAAGPLL